ncbi:MAG: hypothetical protein ACOCTG_04560 [Bacteroidota bacterium]
MMRIALQFFSCLLALLVLLPGYVTGPLHAQDDRSPDIVYLPVNVSLAPGLSIGDAVARATGAEIVNHVSLTIFGGRAHALEGVEFGYIWNSYEAYVRGAQFSGIANSVGGHVRGAQFAGIVNIAGGGVEGGQFSGISNVVDGDVHGVQSAGIANIVEGDMTGAQMSGIANLVSGRAEAQFSGIASVAGGEVGIIQASGTVSVAGGDVTGLQLSGIANAAGQSVRGVQVAGIANVARHATGVQLALVNVAEKSTGAPIGLFSYIGSVGLKYDVWADETGIVSTAVRSGNEYVSNFIGIGAVAGAGPFRWAALAGLGVEGQLSRQVFGSIDVLGYGLRADSWDSWGQLTRLRALVGVHVSRHAAIFFGPSFNVYASTEVNGDEIAPWSVYDTRSDDTFVSLWPGFNIGLRIAPRGR